MRVIALLVVSLLAPAVVGAQDLSGLPADCLLQGKAPEIKVCFKFPVEGQVEVRFWHEPKKGLPGGLYRIGMNRTSGENCYMAVVPPPSTGTGVAEYSFRVKQPGQTLSIGRSVTTRVVASEADCKGGKVAETSSPIPSCGPGLDCEEVHLEPFSGIQHVDSPSNPPGPSAAATAAPVSPAPQGSKGRSGSGVAVLAGLGVAAVAVGVAAKAAQNASGSGSVAGMCQSYSPQNACGGCSCDPGGNDCLGNSACGGSGGDCWTVRRTDGSIGAPFC
jgi:hypothetical protein